MHKEKFTMASDLLDCIRIKYGDWAFDEELKEKYEAYCLCAIYFDKGGDQYWSAPPERLSRLENITAFTKDKKQTIQTPSTPIWREFINEEIVEEWINYRLKENIDRLERNILFSAANTGSFDDPKTGANLKVLKEQRKSLIERSKKNTQPILMMYAPPLLFGKPNLNKNEIIDDGIHYEDFLDEN